MDPKLALETGIIPGLTRCTRCQGRRLSDEPLFVASGDRYGWFCSWYCLREFCTASLRHIQPELVAIQTAAHAAGVGPTGEGER